MKPRKGETSDRRRRSSAIVGADVAVERAIRPPNPVRDLDEFLAFLEEMESLFGPAEKPARANPSTRFLL